MCSIHYTNTYIYITERNWNWNLHWNLLIFVKFRSVLFHRISWKPPIRSDPVPGTGTELYWNFYLYKISSKALIVTLPFFFILSRRISSCRSSSKAKLPWAVYMLLLRQILFGNHRNYGYFWMRFKQKTFLLFELLTSASTDERFTFSTKYLMNVMH